jgi:GR25 family glycosyltransferase involved in LPS biosynthesis
MSKVKVNFKVVFCLTLICLILICVLILLSSGFTNVQQNGFYDKFKSRFVNSGRGKPLPGVDCVYVIAMPQRKDYITQQIDNLGINATYFDAITPQDITTQEYNQFTSINDPASKIYGKYTRFAVLVSFLMCFIDSLANGYSTIVIFEDDISTLVTLETLSKSIVEFNESNLDVFYMGYCFLNCRQPVGKNYDYLVELTTPNLLCCHSMCIKTSVLPDLIKYCLPMTASSDEMFRDFYVKNGVKVCVPKSVYFTQNRESLGTLNESTAGGKLFDTCIFT